MAIKEHDNRRSKGLLVTRDYVGFQHTRIITMPKGEVDAALAEGGALGPGTVMPAQFGGPASATVLSPLLQAVTDRQQREGAMEELTVVYIEILPQPVPA